MKGLRGPPWAALVSLAAAMACLAVAADHASATTIASESFAYAPGELDGQGGGTGWSGLWAAVTSNTEVVASSVPLQYSTGSWSLGGGGYALQVTGASNQSNLIYRSLANPQSGDVWVSFLARWQAGTVNNNDFLVFWFDNSATGDHTTKPNIGIKGDQGAGAGSEDFVVRLTMGTNDDYAGNITPPETANAHLIVGHLYKDASTNYDAFEMWVDPTLADPVGDRTASNFGYAIDDTGNTSLNSFSMIGMRSANLDAGDVILIDEFRLGTTMQDVLQGGLGEPPPMVPEPVTMAGLALGIGCLARYIRRRGRA